MKLENIKTKKQFIKYMKPYGNHVEFIIGNYYTILISNVDYDLFRIRQYAESYSKKNSKRKYKGCYPIHTTEVHSKECVKLIVKEFRKQKLNKLNKLNEI